MKGRAGSRLPQRTRNGIVDDLIIRMKAGSLGDSSIEIFGGDVITQAEIAEKWHVSASTVNKMALDFDKCDAAGVDYHDFS